MPDDRNFRVTPLRATELELYFCARCGYRYSQTTARSARKHQSDAHQNVSPIEGVDFEYGWDILHRLDAEDVEIEKDALRIASLVGPDDFLLECGDA